MRWLARPYALSGVLCALGIAVVYVVYGIVFDTIDDYNVMLTLSGDKTGQPYFQLTFFNSICAFFIALLYRLTDAVQWYSVIQLCLVWASLTAILGSVLERMGHRGRSNIALIPVLAVFAFACFAYPVQRMQFTTTASLLGAASCSFLYLIDPATDEESAISRRLVYSGIFLVLAVLERYTAGICCVAFWVAGVVRLLLYAGEGRQRSVRLELLKKACVTALACFLCVFVFVGGDALVKKYGDNADYMAYNEWRIDYQDHPHPGFDEAEDLYASVGWSREVYNLTTYLIYLDPSINEDAFRTISLAQETKDVQPGLRAAASSAVSLFKSNTTALALALAVLSLCVAILYCILFRQAGDRRRRLCVAVGMVGLLVLSACLAMYLCLSGRWMLRLLQTICFPLIVSLLFLACDALLSSASTQGATRPLAAHAERQECGYAAHGRRRFFGGVPGGRSGLALTSAITLGFCMVGVSAYLAGASMESLQDRDAVSREQMSAVESYVRSNPDKVFVHDMSFTSSKNSYDPFRKNEDEKTSNLVMLGGSYVGTGCFNEQLAQNDLDELNAYTLFRDDVYYISDVSRGFMDATVSYLDSLGLAFDSVQVDDLGNGIGVFKFVPLVDTAPIEESVSGIVPDQSDALRMD